MRDTYEAVVEPIEDKEAMRERLAARIDRWVAEPAIPIPKAVHHDVLQVPVRPRASGGHSPASGRAPWRRGPARKSPTSAPLLEPYALVVIFPLGASWNPWQCRQALRTPQQSAGWALA